MDITSLLNHIADLRQKTLKDSIDPDYLGALLAAIVNAVQTVGQEAGQANTTLAQALEALAGRHSALDSRFSAIAGEAVALADLDTLTGFGQPPVRLITGNIGLLLTTYDPMMHTVIQTVLGNYTAPDGKISAAHADGHVTLCVRSYYLPGAPAVDLRGTWSPWTEVELATLPAQLQAIRTDIKSMADTLADLSGSTPDPLPESPVRVFRRTELVLPVAVSKDMPTEDIDYVVWDTTERRFLGVVDKIASQPQYYASWPDRDYYNPSYKNLYLAEDEHKVYVWDGEDLTPIGTGASTGGDLSGYELMTEAAGRDMAQRIFGDYRFPTGGGSATSGELMTKEDAVEMIDRIFGDDQSGDAPTREYLTEAEVIDMVEKIFKPL